MAPLRPACGGRSRPDPTCALLTTGAVAGPAFVTTFLLEGARRDGYDPLRHPVSSLSLGPGGRVQVANFLLTGAAYLGCAVGLLRARRDRPSAANRAGAVVVGVAGLGLLGAGVFPTDPIGGYPPGTPDTPPAPTPAGVLHNAFSALVFLGIPAGAVACARQAWRDGDRGWAASSLGTAAVFGAAFVQASRGFAHAPRLAARGGLYQRLAIGLGLGWISALALRATLRRRAAGRGRHLRLLRSVN